MSRRRAEPGPLLLLYAEPLQRAGLVHWLEADSASYRVAAEGDAPSPSPALVIWSLAAALPPAALEAEVRQMLDRWQPAPLLLLLPPAHSYSQRFLLALPLQGLLEQPEAPALREAVATLLAGGRVVEIGPAGAAGEGDRL